MSFFERLENDNSYNPLYLDDATGFSANFNEAVLMDDTANFERQQKIKRLTVQYGEEYVRELIERGEL